MHQYHLEVQVPGYDLIYAGDSMPIAPEVYIGNSDVFGLTLGYYGDKREYVISDLNQKYIDKTGKLLFLRGSFYTLLYCQILLQEENMRHLVKAMKKMECCFIRFLKEHLSIDII